MSTEPLPATGEPAPANSDPPASPSRRDVPIREVVVTAGSAGLNREALAELWEYREVLWAFTRRHVKVKYKQMALGVAWAVFQPLIATALIAVFVGRLANLGSPGVPYLAFALCGMVLWTFFNSSVTYGMDSLVREQALLRKLYFPREILPISSIMSFLIDLGVNVVVLLAVLLLMGVGWHWSLLLLPIPIALTLLLATALAVSTSALNVYYRDVRQILPFLLQLGLIASPVVYSVAKVSPQLRELYMILNPMGAAIDATRDMALQGGRYLWVSPPHGATWPDALTLLAAFVWSSALLVGSYWLFKKVEKNLVDQV